MWAEEDMKVIVIIIIMLAAKPTLNHVYENQNMGGNLHCKSLCVFFSPQGASEQQQQQQHSVVYR